MVVCFCMGLSTLRSIRQDLGGTERTTTAYTPNHRKRGAIKHFYRIPLIIHYSSFADVSEIAYSKH